MTRTRSQAASGLTLLEMLVTMVLLSLIVALLSQIFQQTLRMESLLQRYSSSERDIQLRLAWIGDAIEGLTPTPLSDPQSFRGDARSCEGIAAMAPWFDSPGPQRLRWELRRDGADTVLWALDEGERQSLPLLRWAGNSGSWSYLDDDGEWRDSWPPPPQPGSLKGLGLPKALRLRTGLERHAELVWLPKASSLALINRRTLEQ